MERMGESRRKSFVPKATAVRKCRLGKRPLDLDHGMSDGKPRQIRKRSLECRTKELALCSIGTGKQIIQGHAAGLAG